MTTNRADYPDRLHHHSSSEIPKVVPHRQESEAILAALSCDIEDLKKASLALQREVYQDMSLIAGLKGMLGDSSNVMQNIALRVGKLSKLNSYSPIIFLFAVICFMLLTLYIVTKL